MLKQAFACHCVDDDIIMDLTLTNVVICFNEVKLGKGIAHSPACEQADYLWNGGWSSFEISLTASLMSNGIG